MSNDHVYSTASVTSTGRHLSLDLLASFCQPLSAIHRVAVPTVGGGRMEDNRWFHGKVSREAATLILQRDGGREGLFLVRDSSRNPGDYVLSLCSQGQALHFVIKHNGDYYYSIDDGPVFRGLEALIYHYKLNSDGLPCKLFSHCLGKPPPKAQFDKIDSMSSIPLMEAARNGDELTVKALLAAGADGKFKDSFGNTPLKVRYLVGSRRTCKAYLAVPPPMASMSMSSGRWSEKPLAVLFSSVQRGLAKTNA